jgi:hypothetical protein
MPPTKPPSPPADDGDVELDDEFGLPLVARPLPADSGPPPEKWPTEKWAPAECIICHTPITQPKTGRPRLTCSDRCRQRWRRRNIVKSHADDGIARELRIIDRTAERLERRFGPPRQRDEYLRIGLRIARGWPVLACKLCGRPFIVDSPSGAWPMYCSRQCTQRAASRAHRRRQRGHHTEPLPHTKDEKDHINLRLSRGIPVATCPECGRLFIDYNSVGRPRKYCSTRCRQRAWAFKRRPLYRICHHCGRRYRVAPRHRGRQRYCSRRCNRRSRSRQPGKPGG